MQNIFKVSAAETGWNHELNLMRCNVHWLGKKKKKTQRFGAVLLPPGF